WAGRPIALPLSWADDPEVNERQYHSIDDYLSEDWISDWALEVVAEIETYLAKHAAFDAFSDGTPPAASA
ncbi:MAG TPA: hypothetical protein VHK22_04590, partial [Gaiellaceae bacterium]|nr:hypothetical protein [Gaiellaceae bacterium]